jgi:hypothetical protein
MFRRRCETVARLWPHSVKSLILFIFHVGKARDPDCQADAFRPPVSTLNSRDENIVGRLSIFPAAARCGPQSLSRPIIVKPDGARDYLLAPAAYECPGLDRSILRNARQHLDKPQWRCTMRRRRRDRGRRHHGFLCSFLFREAGILFAPLNLPSLASSNPLPSACSAKFRAKSSWRHRAKSRRRPPGA